ncbi:MAG: acyl-CoA dehydrogenase family protein [Porticoccaceae bacterium]|jgi:acyl-CoA dehydrogenase|nr:MAG: acyl-CoA dehydrogenase [SAR92 bacterium BACL16 MAG-120619-bin48]KRP24353.1 MAG: acyl-CoA dehydrogenase [SAR92 bacterium BACL16 MAG-120322-bin99]MDO7634513.1 acyl-CoA dehydrogenase family protein [Porticoccaceae bacterium]MDP4653669.1 acyl-CoA dehydrogenase family protein [Alphaproteobacteria bacterium]MDP4743812.1 acyl-CoA dehydrogenase family protein [Porticoccaceae bacterium]
MDLGISDKVAPILAEVKHFIDTEILPLEYEYHQEVEKGDRWAFTERQTEIMETLKAKAKQKNLWNFFLTHFEGGHGLNTVEYAYIAEETGRSQLAPEVFNCAAPDTGNMEVLARFCNEEQKERWLKPLLAGEIRSAYVMTEPGVASSDATNIAMSCVEDGDEWVLNGEKIWISGAGDPRCKILIVMCNTNPGGPRHSQHSQVLVPSDTPGIQVLRPMTIFGKDDAPHGHMHMRFTDVRVPKENMILGQGRGFEVAQGRLGPGRIHHCMRSLGLAEAALKLLCERALSREAFGRPLAKLGGNIDIIADARIQIEMTRLLCLKAAWLMDNVGTDAAQPYISMIKVAAPNMALKIIDEAMQMYGGLGLSQDTPLAVWYGAMRTLRFADGPDAVHRMVIGRRELRQYSS